MFASNISQKLTIEPIFLMSSYGLNQITEKIFWRKMFVKLSQIINNVIKIALGFYLTGL